MPEITITLDEETAVRLRELAQQCGQTPEEAATALIAATLPSLPRMEATASWSGEQKEYSTLDIVGILTDVEPIRGGNQEIDRILAKEYANPHDDE